MWTPLCVFDIRMHQLDVRMRPFPAFDITHPQGKWRVCNFAMLMTVSQWPACGAHCVSITIFPHTWGGTGVLPVQCEENCMFARRLKTLDMIWKTEQNVSCNKHRQTLIRVHLFHCHVLHQLQWAHLEISYNVRQCVFHSCPFPIGRAWRAWHFFIDFMCLWIVCNAGISSSTSILFALILFATHVFIRGHVPLDKHGVASST